MSDIIGLVLNFLYVLANFFILEKIETVIWAPLLSNKLFFSVLLQDTQKAKQFLPFLQRAGRSEAVVEYVFSGSRLKLYLPKETCLITFLLAGKSLWWARLPVLPSVQRPASQVAFPPSSVVCVGLVGQQVLFLWDLGCYTSLLPHIPPQTLQFLGERCHFIASNGHPSTEKHALKHKGEMPGCSPVLAVTCGGLWPERQGSPCSFCSADFHSCLSLMEQGFLCGCASLSGWQE